MREDFCDFIFVLERTIQSRWKIEQLDKYVLVLWNSYAYFFQNVLE